MNIKAFAGVNDVCEKPNGEKLPHEELFTQVVNGIGLDTCERYMPVTTEKLRDALEKDLHLSTIKLKEWEAIHFLFQPMFDRIGVSQLSKSDMTCTLKQAARMLVARNYPDAPVSLNQEVQTI